MQNKNSWVTLRREALKVLEPSAGRLARTVLRGRKLPGGASETSTL
ncbi:hypothetical protein OAA06_01025 [bacterium]|nr:hypothetical protein [bacterium]